MAETIKRDRNELLYRAGEVRLHIETIERAIADAEYERGTTESDERKRRWTELIKEYQGYLVEFKRYLSIYESRANEVLTEKEAIDWYMKMWRMDCIHGIYGLVDRFSTESELDANRMLKAVKTLTNQYNVGIWRNGWYQIVFKLPMGIATTISNLQEDESDD